MLHETGGVPFEILEPVLERCTPEQLVHIEECNPVRKLSYVSVVVEVLLLTPGIHDQTIPSVFSCKDTCTCIATA